MTFCSINPTNEEVVDEFPELDASAIDSALDFACEAFRHHSTVGVAARAERMTEAANILEAERETWGRMLTEEMGKPITAAMSEVDKCAWVCRYYAENAETFTADEPIKTDSSHSFVRHLPLGPVLAVMPWNFPFWQVFRFAAPALMAGNVGLLKHASNVPRSALAIQDIFARAGFERGVFQTLLIGSDKVERILSDDRVKAATLTGSEAAGSAVAATCGKHIKKTVLELGGSDPFIIMPSADLDKAADAAVKSRTINNGQSCIAAKRFLIHADVYDDFMAKFADGFDRLAVGDPMHEQIDIGPLATAQIRDEVEQQVDGGVTQGAVRVIGAQRLAGKGFFYQPGIVANISGDAALYSEEVFGPVALAFKVRDIDEAISLSNATRFGLASSLWTTDEDEMTRAMNGIDAGATFVNTMVASDPRLPFGGVKASGYGRELSLDGMREFVNRKTIVIA